MTTKPLSDSDRIRLRVLANRLERERAASGAAPSVDELIARDAARRLERLKEGRAWKQATASASGDSRFVGYGPKKPDKAYLNLKMGEARNALYEARLMRDRERIKAEKAEARRREKAFTEFSAWAESLERAVNRKRRGI